MISVIISVFIGVMHELFKDDCKQTVKYNEYNICLINYYVTCIIVFFICPYIVTKIFYNTANDRLYRAFFYLFLFITLILFV
jgi:hypothetical protein